MMLIGDFSEGTGLLNHFEHGGNQCTNTEYINSQISRTRRNELCKSNNLYILNGKKEGDTLGRFIHYNTKQAPSTIDYAISSYDLFQKISHFIVKRESCLSDHCQIVTWFEIDKQNKDNPQWKKIYLNYQSHLNLIKLIIFFFGRIGIIQNTNKNYIFSSAIIPSD